MNWYFEVFRKYAVFNGRARRREYWYFQLFNILAIVILMVIDSAMAADSPGILTGLYYLAMILPALAVTVRRLHDSDRSGWWFLISMIPFVGGIVLLIFTVLEGTAGDNRYGPDPKA